MFGSRTVVRPALVPHIYFPVAHAIFSYMGLLWNRAKAFVVNVRKSTHATQELRNLQKQQVLKDTPKGDSLFIDPKIY